MAIGRRAKSHRCSWDNSEVLGLYKMPGNRPRWRYKDPNGKYIVFTEADERIAVSRFRAAQVPKTVPIHAELTDFLQDPESPSIKFERIAVPADKFWADLRKLILTKPEYVAKMTGIPEIANLRYMPIPKDALVLSDLLKLYVDKNDAVGRTKGQVKAAWNKLTQATGAKRLDDLTTEVLIDFRQKIVESGIQPTGAAQIFAKIKAVLAFALKYGEDPAQLTAAIGRMKVLYAPKSDSHPEPCPISREHFHALLNFADDEWRLMLLLGLNCAFYIEDLCNLKWSELDLAAGTFKGIRNKTKVARVAVLWPETIEALKKWPHRAKSPYVFTSQTGTRFNGASRYNTYKSLRERATVSDPFSALRDAAYTTAAQNCEERYARVLAGHRSAGLQDSYVLRNPQFVKPATDAVYKAYGPFPLPTPPEQQS